MERRGLLLGAGAYLAWGLLSPGNALVLEHMGPLWMQAQRALFAFAVVVVVWPRSLPRAHALLADLRLLAAVGLGAMGALLLFAIAQTRIAAAETTLGFFTAPIWTGLLAWWVIGERVGRVFWGATVLLLVGGALALDVQGIDQTGLLLAVGSGVAWAFYSVGLRQQGAGIPWQDLLVFSLGVGAAAFFVLALLFEPMPSWSGLPPVAWRWVVVQTLVPTLLSVALFQSALQQAPAAKVNLLVGLELVGTVFFAWLLLGATFGPRELLGIVLVLIAATAATVRRSTVQSSP